MTTPLHEQYRRQARWCRWELLLLGCVVGLGCAGRSEPSSPLEPTLGRSQPVPITSTSSEASVAEPVEPISTEPIPTEPAPTEPTSSEPTPPSEPAPTEPPAIAPPAAATEVEDALCSHITAVVLSESDDASGLTGEQVDELIASCSLALAQDRRKLGEAEFRRRADCVRKASSVAGFSACQPPDADSPESR